MPPRNPLECRGQGIFERKNVQNKTKSKGAKMYQKRRKMKYKKSKRQFLEGAVNQNKMNNKSVDRGGIRL